MGSLASDRLIAEMLKPPHMRSFTGSWLLGCETLLRKLTSHDQPRAAQLVGPAFMPFSGLVPMQAHMAIVPHAL